MSLYSEHFSKTEISITQNNKFMLGATDKSSINYDEGLIYGC